MIERLTPQAVEGFISQYLLPHYDKASPLKAFHREWLALACDPDPRVGLAAPRSHSKTVTFNHGYSIASAALEFLPYQLKVSSTRDIAIEFLQANKLVFTENVEFQQDFGFRDLEKDTEDDFIAVFVREGEVYKCRMRAFGAEQKMRGVVWGTRRPSLILCDDMEDDEQVMNSSRREKLRKWFMRTLLPIGDTDTVFRVVGTVLHIDSLLNMLLKSENWKTAIYKAHGDNFTAIMWPERFPKKYWINLRKSYMEQHDLIGYNMEYLNTARDEESGFYQSQDFVAMGDADDLRTHAFYVGGDLAISLNTQRDRTCFVVGGVDSEGFLSIVDVRRGHWDAKQILDEMISIQETYHPDEWYVEDGAIKKAMGSYFELRMRQEQEFINLAPKTTPVADKMSRSRPMQGRMRQKAVKFNKNADWYGDFETEMLNFRGGNERNDQPDAMAWLGIGLQRMVAPLSAEDEEEVVYKKHRDEFMPMGRSVVTGY